MRFDRVEVEVAHGHTIEPEHLGRVGGERLAGWARTDAAAGALGALAASQGTMNNFTFGNATYQYYETIAGGSGAGPGFDGASAVQTHMTNTRNTPVEEMELRLPVRVHALTVRRGSGGRGRRRGGDGLRKVVAAAVPAPAAVCASWVSAAAASAPAPMVAAMVLASCVNVPATATATAPAPVLAQARAIAAAGRQVLVNVWLDRSSFREGSISM